MTTMRDIAEAANVSRAAVSAVLNGNKHIRVSKEKQDIILTLARKMNYRPNLIARSLVSRSTRTIGVYFCAPTDRFYAEMLTVIQRELRKHNYIGNFIFWESQSDIQYAYDLARGQRVDGIITCHSDVSMLPAGTPAVIFGTRSLEMDCFYPDWENIYAKYLHYLTGMGHRSIAFLGDVDTRPVQAIEFAKAAGKYDVSVTFFPCQNCRISIAQTADALLKLPERPTAIVGCNDVSALTVINELSRRHIRVPEDISVIGFDNISDGLYSVPPLTTAGIDLASLVDNMLKTVFQRIAEPDAPVKTVPLDYELIIRDSVRPPGSS